MKNLKTYVMISSVCSLLLIGCSAESSSSSSTTESSISVQEIDPSKDTKGEWIKIQSDNVSLAGYDASTQRMTVTFDNGKSYWYQPVDQSVWIAFYNAQPHPWSQVGYPALVESGIPYGRLN
jgi:uncharacterized protein RhaS with RHS repeats